MTTPTAPAASPAPSAETARRQVVIRTDDRVRLMSAVLAATNYPERAQERKKHGTHTHARGTRSLVAEYSHHPAVHGLQVLLDQDTALASVYSYALRLTWPGLEAGDEAPRWVPPRWHEHLRHFYEQTGLEKLWADDAPHWQTPIRHLREAFAAVDLYQFLHPFVGHVVESFAVMPNISHPTDQTVSLRLGGELIAIMPPPTAWGDSPPWPYKDDPALAYKTALNEFGRMLMSAYLRQHDSLIAQLAEKPLPVDEKYAAANPTWRAQFMGLFTATITALFLEDTVSALEAKSFTQYMQKVEHLSALPGVVNVFRRYLEDYRAGRYASFADYLPNFAKHLRVAKTIAAL